MPYEACIPYDGDDRVLGPAYLHLDWRTPGSTSFAANDAGIAQLENLLSALKADREEKLHLKEDIQNDLGGITANFNNYLIPKVQALTSKIHENNTDGVTDVRYSRPAEDIRYFMKLLNELKLALDTLPS